jgi:hypothetical protein
VTLLERILNETDTCATAALDHANERAAYFIPASQLKMTLACQDWATAGYWSLNSADPAKKRLLMG